MKILNNTSFTDRKCNTSFTAVKLGYCYGFKAPGLLEARLANLPYNGTIYAYVKGSFDATYITITNQNGTKYKQLGFWEKIWYSICPRAAVKTTVAMCEGFFRETAGERTYLHAVPPARPSTVPILSKPKPSSPPKLRAV